MGLTPEQGIVIGLLVAVLAGLLWGRFRYDLVAFAALIAGVLLGVVPAEEAFSGFGHPATVIVALVLVVSHGLVASGAVGAITRRLIDASRGLAAHVAIMGGVGAVLSAFMNNVAALALLMPVDIQTAQKAGRSPGLSLMPLSFATILGGLATQIGTPPNIIIASYREEALGAPFAMFDFAPVGVLCAGAGLAFIVLVGWRLIPAAREEKAPAEELHELADYVAELVIPEDSDLAGKQIADLDDAVEEADLSVIGLVRRKRRMVGAGRNTVLSEGDALVLEGQPEAIEELRSALGLAWEGDERVEREAGDGEPNLLEVVMPEGARAVGQSALSLRLLRRFGVTLLGISRQGRRIRERVQRAEIEAGDILLLLGPPDRLPDVAAWLGALPLAPRGLSVTREDRALIAGGAFALAVVAASLGLVYLPVALGAVVVVHVLGGIISIREVYDHVEWPVVVLLGSMIPLGAALDDTGGTALIAEGLVALTEGLPAWAVLAVLMAVTMTLSDVLNNTATTIVAAPVALGMAEALGVNPDAFLMAVAVAASCAFLTPIGHKNNTLILGPGGYAFGDYWPLGLPLEILVIAVGVPAILVVWPL
jgi:di/tricarboxylate transporter